MSLVSTDWVEKNLSSIKILDASWHLPVSKRDAEQEFLSDHIQGAQFFNLDKNSDDKNFLPHMLQTK